MPELAIIIPAAGKSARMGKPKQLLEYKSESLIGHCIDMAKSLGPYVVYVILGANSEKIKPEVEKHQAGILINADWQKGLGSSIALGVSTILKDHPETRGVLVLLPDQPLISRNHLEQIITEYDFKKGSIVATKYPEGKFGVPALFDCKYFNQLMKLSGDFGAKELIGSNLDQTLLIDPGDEIFDIDTPEDYSKLIN